MIKEQILYIYIEVGRGFEPNQAPTSDTGVAGVSRVVEKEGEGVGFVLIYVMKENLR